MFGDNKHRNSQNPHSSHGSASKPSSSSYSRVPGSQDRSTSQASKLHFDKKVGYILYKYLIGIALLYEVLVFGSNFLGIYGSTLKLVCVHILNIFLSGWSINQLLTEFQAIQDKDLQKARKAVRLMKWYMLILPLVTLIYIQFSPASTTGQQAQIKLRYYLPGPAIGIVLADVLVVGIFYLYGAIKVRNSLFAINNVSDTIPKGI